MMRRDDRLGGGDKPRALRMERVLNGASLFHQPSDMRAKMCVSFRCDRRKERSHVRRCGTVALLSRTTKQKPKRQVTRPNRPQNDTSANKQQE